MVKAICVHEPGSAEVLSYEEIELPPDRRRISAFRLLPDERFLAFAEWEAKSSKVRY